MKMTSKRNALRIRTLMAFIGLLLSGVSVAGAFKWINFGNSGQLALGNSIFIFIMVGWPLSGWLRRHVQA